MDTSVSLGHSLRHSLRITQSLHLTPEIRLRIQNLALQLRLALIQALRGEEYEPAGECPKCRRNMTPVEIIRGFNNDPNDYTTACSGCGFRFAPMIVCRSEFSRIELPFFCPCQTLDQLQGKEALSPEQLKKEHGAIFHSAIVHHGGLRKAFAKIGIEYPFEEIGDWRDKIKPFLGRMSDVEIAMCVNVSTSTIQKMRQALGIERFSRRRALAEMEA